MVAPDPELPHSAGGSLVARPNRRRSPAALPPSSWSHQRMTPFGSRHWLRMRRVTNCESPGTALPRGSPASFKFTAERRSTRLLSQVESPSRARTLARSRNRIGMGRERVQLVSDSGQSIGCRGVKLEQQTGAELAKCSWPWWIRTTINGSKVRCPAVGRRAIGEAAKGEV
jgi:hypothetical protein